MSEILVIREKDDFTRVLIERNFSVVNFPTIETKAATDLSELDGIIARIERFDGIFITSAAATKIVLEKLREARKEFGGKFYVLGEQSVELLKTSGYEFFSSEQATTAEELLKLIPIEELANKKFLFPRGNRSLRVVPETLRTTAEIVETIVYQTSGIETNETERFEVKEKFAAGKIDAICFFSPSGAEEFLKSFDDFVQNEIKIAVIGKTTARFVESKKLRVDFVAAKPTAKDFADDLTEYLRKEI